MAATTFLAAEARLQELRRVEIEMRDLRRRMDALEHTKAVLLELDADEAPRRAVPSGAGLRALIMGASGPKKPRPCA